MSDTKDLLVLYRRRRHTPFCARLTVHVHSPVEKTDPRRGQEWRAQWRRCQRSDSSECALLLVIISDITGDTTLDYGGFPCPSN
jgi:hypothetical protein